MSAAVTGRLQPQEIRGRVDLLGLHVLAPTRYPFLLESAAEHPSAGRFDILFADPADVIESGHGAAGAHRFFDALDGASQHDPAGFAADLPFAGGWFLLLGYEAARGVEPAVDLPNSPYALPDALAVRCTAAVIYDRVRDCTVLFAESDPRQLERLVSDCAAVAHSKAPAGRVGPLVEGCGEDDPARFTDGVGRIQEYLRTGATFQVNLSRAWRGHLRPEASYVDVYRRLREKSPAPFAGLARWAGSAVLSSSPERLLSISGGIAQTRPIAGTHARLPDTLADLAQRARLIGSLKERAEHVMLIDLERNDLGRVCEPGSVEVSELMAVESYSHVHHIVSNIRGRLRPDVGAGAALRAVFPGGTITGCPKVRSMQIIAELEGVGRGPYTGAMGYLSRCGRLDTNILIRTIVCESGQLSFRTGAGIVADSEPLAELAETRAKARGMLLALGVPYR